MKLQLHEYFFITLLSACLFLSVTRLAWGQAPVTFSALPTPTPAMGGPASSGSALGATALPDLIVTDIKSNPASPLLGQPTTLEITIKNNSNTALNFGNNFNVDLYIDPPIEPQINYHQIISPTLGLPWGVQSFWVPANTSYVLETTWVFTQVQTFEVWTQVDTDNNVAEVDETNNNRKANITVLTPKNFKHTGHQDFQTNMASTLVNDDPTGLLRLGRFPEPPFVKRPYTNASCQIAPSLTDYNIKNPDNLLAEPTPGEPVPSTQGLQVNPYLVAAGDGRLIAVWEDGRDGDILDRDIYLRYSINYGQSWSSETKVNDDVGETNQTNPVVAISENGNLLVAWQDRRSGVSYDIYVQRFLLSGNTLTEIGNNLRVDTDNQKQDQINPDIAVDEDANFYIVWQDKRNGNYDIFNRNYLLQGGNYVWSPERRVNDDTLGKQQSNPAINALEWLQVTDITYDDNGDGTVTVTGVISEPLSLLVVVWEDYSHDNADIAITLSNDRGETFIFDAFINDDSDSVGSSFPNQLDPDVTLTPDKEEVTIKVLTSEGEVEVPVEVPVTAVHTVWQDFRSTSPGGSDDPDIYYSLSQLGVEQQDNIFALTLSVGSNEKVNQEDTRSWQTGPVKQQDPAITAVQCGGDASPEQWNRFITWADGRNYDSLNFDIYYSIRSDCGASFEGNELLNDGVRLHTFNTANPVYGDYNAGYPPPARQLNPSVAADIELEGSTVYGGYLYLAWEDDRAGDPQVEKDIYWSRTNLTYANQPPYNPFNDSSGSHISNVLDSGTVDTTWYTVSWSGATDASTYITVQTRLGNTVQEVLASNWYPQRYPFQPQPNDCTAEWSGAPIAGYSAPGQSIEGSSGNSLPKARYIQYRVNFYSRDETKTPELYDLTLYYNPGGGNNPGPGVGNSKVYLPLIRK